MISARLVRKYLWITWRGTVLLPRTIVLIAWLLLRERGPHRRAVASMKAALSAPRVGDDPLRAIGPALHEVAPWFLRHASPRDEHTARAVDHPRVALDPRVLTVVHFLGTGENVYSPLPGLAGVCRAEPRLAALRHVIVDTPFDAASYLGPSELGMRLRRAIAPLLEGQACVVLTGLSRGATVALNLGTELADAHGVRVGMLALSPPLVRPRKAPASVLNIGGLEPIAENFARQLQLNPWLRSLGNAIFRELYLRFTAFVFVELRILSSASLAGFARYFATVKPRDACLRAVREFALLGRVSDAELRHAISGVTQRLARCEHAHAIVAWGQGDAWVDVAPCQSTLATLVARDGVPSERLRVVTLPGVNHALGREPEQDFAPLAALLWEACEFAQAPAAASTTTLGTLTESTA